MVNTNKKRTDPRLSYDNDNDNVSPCQGVILKYLETAQRVTDLSKATKRKAPNICRDLKILANKGLAIKENGAWRLSNYALSLIHYRRLDGYPQMIIPSKKEKVGLCEFHNVSFTLKFWNVPDGWDRLRMPGLMFGMGLPPDHPQFNYVLAESVDKYSYNSQIGGGALNLYMDGYTVSCQSPSVKIWIPSVVADSPEEGMLKVFNLLLEFLPLLEHRLRLPDNALYSHGRLNIKVSSRHIVLLRSVLGEVVKEVVGNYLVIHAPDGKQGFILDSSFGCELENVNVAYGVEPTENLSELENALGSEGVKSFVHDYAYGLAPSPSEQYKSIQRIEGSIRDWENRLIPTMDYFAKNIEAHVGTAEANLSLARSLKELLERFEIIFGRFDSIFDFVLKWKRILRL